MNIVEVEKYLRDDIKRSIQNDVYPLVASSNVPEDGGLFAGPRLIFAYVDFFGYLYRGVSSSESAVAFLRDYFGKADARYKEVGGLLYHIYRHGTVHEYEPKSILLSDGTRIAWYVYKGGGKESHLSGHLNASVLQLRLHIDSLYEHLNCAIDFYIEDLKKNADLQQKFEKARTEIQDAEKEADIRKKGKAYLHNSDFTFIKDLCAKASSST